MKKKVLISAPYMVRDRAKVEPLLHAHPLELTWAPVRERLEENDLLTMLPGYHGIICGDDRITPKVIDHAKELQVIVKWGTGIDSIHKAYAEKKGIPVYRTPNAFTEPVADTTLAYILSFCRGVVANDRVLKSGGWDKPKSVSLGEVTIGLIGFGDIGAAVARRLKPFGPRVLACDIKPERRDVAQGLGVEFVSFQEILSSSDFVSLHCDLNESSFHIVGEGALAAVAKAGRKPVVVNTARGPLVEEPALIRALESGTLSGAALDVFEEEPLSKASPLRAMQNVLLASHNSNNSPRCWDFVHQNSVRMLVKGLAL